VREPHNLDDQQRPANQTEGDQRRVTSRDAVSLGLIVTELVLNAVKHAFLYNKIDHRITVAYDVAGTNWQLSVADNGSGKPAGEFAPVKAGLGTSIVKALAQQLDARVEVSSGAQGTTVSVSHATFSKMPRASLAAADVMWPSIRGRA
jgi:two-component sensor histidine kinase